MHYELNSIKSEKFIVAEQNLELIKCLLELEGSAEIFVDSQNFLPSSALLNGK